MGYFTDCGLLVLLSFLRLFYRLPDAGFLIAFLCTVILVCSTYALGKKCIRIVLGAGMGLLALVIPEMFFFYPCLFYLFFCEKMPLLALGAWALLVCRTMGSWENGLFFAAAGSLGLLFAFFMERNTRKCSSLEEELKRTRDDSRERDLLLSQKNKALLEKQDYEIYNATLNSIRSSVHDLHDEAVNLREAEEGLVRDFTFCQAELTYDMTQEIPREVKYCFISITKEAFANIMKHSNATRVQLILREHPALYQMCVEDNGTGVVYDPGNAGIGILNMKDRVKALGGTLQISTRKGFRIFITIPK